MNIKWIKNRRSLAFIMAVIVVSCSQERSPVTGWAYNDPANGGFEKPPYEEQETGPGLVLIEGGTFTMGRTENDVTYEWNNVPRRVTISSFYMDETEVSNLSYLEYLFWTNKVFGPVFPDIYYKALPDTLVWREKLAYNEPYVEYYLRHPAYRDYPVVGVNWLQANEFCAWRTDRVNEFILIREGLLEHTQAPSDQDYFSTEAYLSGKWQGQLKTKLPSFDGQNPERDVKMEDGIFLPKYRLPTEAEWEFAAYGLIGNTIGERITDRRIYPWNGHGVRNATDKYLGQINANFVRGAGDYMGTAGFLNDNADVTAPVYSYWPNDYGLYNMSGNVCEWVMDVYRPNTLQDADEFRPFRGNVFSTQVRDSTTLVGGLGGEIMTNVDGPIYQKFTHKVNNPTRHGTSVDPIEVVDSVLAIMTVDPQGNNNATPEGKSDIPGRVQWREVSSAVSTDNLDERRNYKAADYINYMDGDVNSSIYFAEGEDAYTEKAAKLMYEYAKTSLINDKSRVFKGGSWRDRAFFLVPGTRRYLDQRQASAWLGFRCSMTRVGSPVGLGSK
ncbi:SUMF1/EgtB/PvdO family nonheme iron enzyme [Aurantibacillus circumpalustris]|uniref:SUMF1/EgtB/PvdO family nonheme iron enzyme n=1 Tax=Aurantibacillus circumpalustris TaxID=3036359 RepID=UPI00295B9987|nr:SUMF1/EgtB/PvdO family nonheme iron enzyme [Aurantibacillus circumpalustris]